MVVIPYVERLPELPSYYNDSTEIEKRNGKDEERNEYRELCRREFRIVIGDETAQHRKIVTYQMTAGVPHENLCRGGVEEPEPESGTGHRRPEHGNKILDIHGGGNCEKAESYRRHAYRKTIHVVEKIYCVHQYHDPQYGDAPCEHRITYEHRDFHPAPCHRENGHDNLPAEFRLRSHIVDVVVYSEQCYQHGSAADEDKLLGYFHDAADVHRDTLVKMVSHKVRIAKYNSYRDGQNPGKAYGHSPEKRR